MVMFSPTLKLTPRPAPSNVFTVSARRVTIVVTNGLIIIGGCGVGETKIQIDVHRPEGIGVLHCVRRSVIAKISRCCQGEGRIDHGTDRVEPGTPLVTDGDATEATGQTDKT